MQQQCLERVCCSFI